MKQDPKHQIMFDSPEAASIKTVTGWVSRNGMFFGADGERSARYSGCTHWKCSTEGCETPTEKGWTHCPACREERDIAKYNALPKERWDGTGMIFSDAKDKYYNDMDEAEDDLDETESLESLRLLICIPNFARTVEEDYWSDDLPEDGELPDGIRKALDELNKAIRELGPISWTPGRVAVLTACREALKGEKL